MNRKVLFRSAAEADLTEAHAWYELRKRGLGDEFLAVIAEALLRIEQTPEETARYAIAFDESIRNLSVLSAEYRTHTSNGRLKIGWISLNDTPPSPLRNSWRSSCGTWLC